MNRGYRTLIVIRDHAAAFEDDVLVNILRHSNLVDVFDVDLMGLQLVTGFLRRHVFRGTSLLLVLATNEFVRGVLFCQDAV